MKNQFTVLPEVAKYLEEARLLTGEALATSLTNTALAFWHDLVSKFVNAPSEHDIHQHGVDGNFLCLKMTPGADVIESVYDRVIDRADDLTKALNDKFGKKVFQTKLSRDGGELSVLVAFVESDGGVFQCKSEAEGGSYAVALRCPNSEQLKIAFNAMAQVPTPDADMDGDIDANDAPELEDEQQYDEGTDSKDEIDSEDMDPSLAPEMEVDPDYELPQNIVINEGELSNEDQSLYDLAKKVYHQAETGSDLEKLAYGIMAHLKSMIVAGKSMNTEAREKAELLLGRLCNEEVAGTSVAGAIAGGQSPAPAVVADAGPRKKTKHKFVTLQRHGMSGGPFS